MGRGDTEKKKRRTVKTLWWKTGRTWVGGGGQKSWQAHLLKITDESKQSNEQIDGSGKNECAKLRARSTRQKPEKRQKRNGVNCQEK